MNYDVFLSALLKHDAIELKGNEMRYLLSLIFVFSLQAAWADMTLTVLDQNGLPVADSVIILSDSPVSTPGSVAVMNQIYSSFVPRVLVIQKNQSVSFPNSDDIRHHVYSFSIPKAFEIKLYKGKEIPPVVFDTSGIVVLGCNIHDSMIGYIIIANNTFAAKTDKDGKVRLPAKKGDKISLWTERDMESVTAMSSFNITSDTEQSIKLDLLPPIKIEDHSNHN
jgi:plastocyanin